LAGLRLLIRQQIDVHEILAPAGPTTRNLAPAADNADNISTKSRFIEQSFLEHPGLERQLPHHGDAFARRQTPHVVVLAFICE
jgi:hypothetical protein